MSDPTFQTPVYHRAKGSALTVDSGGTVQVLSGGSIQVASGGVLNIASGGSIVNAGEQAITGNITIPSGGTITVASGGSIQQAGAQHITGLTNVASGGSINVASGGSVQVASGGQIRAAAATGLSLPAGMLMNGTVMKLAMGTMTLTSGVGTLGVVGFTRVMAATGNVILGEASGLGSPTSVHTDYSLAGAGSVIFRAVAGTIGYAANVNIGYQAMGT